MVHADETPVSLLAPGKGKTKRAYVWVYRTTNFVAQRAVLFDFSMSRGGDNARRVLQGFGGTLMSDDFSGYHALQSQGVTAALCMAHARRKLFEAHQFNGSEIARQAVALIAKLYEVEHDARELEPDARWRLRQQRSRPIVEALHRWLTEQRQKLAKADVTAKAIDYALSNWRGLTQIPRRRRCPDRQQCRGERGAPALRWTQKLAFRGLAAGRRTRRRGAQPDRIGQAQRARSVGLSEGRIRAATDAQAPRSGTTAAAQLAADGQCRRGGLADRRRERIASISSTSRSARQESRSPDAYGVGDFKQFKSGHQFGAWLGIVPRQNSSGGKASLGRITKRGDDYLRTLLIQGAKSAVMSADKRDDPISRWLVQLTARVGWQKACVAMANKNARILWAVMTREQGFDPSTSASSRRPRGSDRASGGAGRARSACPA